MKLTGVLSPADIEANYQGFDLVFGVVFEYTSLDGVSFTHCHLRLSVDGWALPQLCVLPFMGVRSYGGYGQTTSHHRTSRLIKFLFDLKTGWVYACSQEKKLGGRKKLAVTLIAVDSIVAILIPVTSGLTRLGRTRG